MKFTGFGTPLIGLRGKSLQRAIATISGLGFLLFGYDQGVLGGLLTLDSFVASFPSMDTVNTIGSIKSSNAKTQGIVVAIYEIGCASGAALTYFYGDRLGRKRSIFVGAVVMTIGGILQTSATSIPHLVIGRISSGIGNGFITATVPCYQSECAKPHDRGYLVMIEGALITGGIMIAYWGDLIFSFVSGEASWRAPVGFQLLFSILIFLLVLDLPESPRLLVKNGLLEEAAEVFSKLDDVDINHPSVQANIDEIVASLPLLVKGSEKPMTTTEMLFSNRTKEKHAWRVSLGFWIQVMQQISGINLITYYASTLFQTSIGLSPLNSRILAAANGTEYFIASWIAVLTIEKYGRRKLMIFGAAGQSATMALLTVTVYLASTSDTLPFAGPGYPAAGIVAAILLFVFNTFFSIGWLGMAWLYPAEILSISMRAPGAAISTGGDWIFNFLVVLITPIAFDSIGYYTYSIFAVINFLMVPVCYFLYPETAGRSLEEIDDIFENANPWRPWEVVAVAERTPFRSKIGVDGSEASIEGKNEIEAPIIIEDITEKASKWIE